MKSWFKMIDKHNLIVTIHLQGIMLGGASEDFKWTIIRFLQRFSDRIMTNKDMRTRFQMWTNPDVDSHKSCLFCC